MKRVFFDASVLFSALYSSNGGSHALIQYVRQGKIAGITSQTVVEELIANIHKIDTVSKKQVENFIITSGLIVREHVLYDEIEQYIGLVEDKDVHVIVGTVLTKCKFLATLDKKHLNNQKVKKLFQGRFVIASPKELLKEL